MLDETTYYFTAFAIDQNNNIIDSQTLSITTDFGWHVTPNTVARYKLESDLIDYSGNNHNGTWNGSGSFTTVGGKLSANFNTNNYIDTGIITGSGPITIACIFYHNTTSGNYQTVIGSPLSRNGTSNPHIGMCFSNQRFYRWAGRFYENENSMPALSSFERHFGSIRIDSNGNVKLNIDDNQKTGTTSSFTINADILIGAGIGNRFNGNVKQVAIWNESITDEELMKFKAKALG